MNAANDVTYNRSISDTDICKCYNLTTEKLDLLLKFHEN